MKTKKDPLKNIENTLNNQDSRIETDAEKLEYFRKKILGRLDNLQTEEDKKVIPFPQKNVETVDNNLIPLSREEALENMKAGERLVNGKDRFDIAYYHWHEDRILKSDLYYDLYGEGDIIPTDELPQLYRIGKDGNFRNISDSENYWKNKKRNNP